MEWPKQLERRAVEAGRPLTKGSLSIRLAEAAQPPVWCVTLCVSSAHCCPCCIQCMRAPGRRQRQLCSSTLSHSFTSPDISSPGVATELGYRENRPCGM
eukprot:359972-Chlamydomonas_euryale.AAC.2